MSLVVLAAASWIAGNRLLRSIRMQGIEPLALRLLVGMSLCSAVVAGLGAVSLDAARFLLNAFALAGLGYHLYLYKAAEGTDTPRERLDAVEKLSLLAVLSAACLALFGALAPATSWDACVAHLALAKDYTREGRILFVPGNEYTAYPHLLHVLYACVFAQDGERGAMLLGWLMGLLACAAAYMLGARVESRRCGLIAAAILATAPIFIDQAGTVSIDLAFCAFAVGAMAALAAWFKEREAAAPWLLLAGWLAGSSCGIRHTGYLVCVLLSLGVLLGARERRFRSFVLFVGISVLAASPWLLRSGLITGNPFYPLFISWFGAGSIPHWPVGFMAPHPSLDGFSLRQFLMFPWDIVMRPYLFDGWSKSPGGLVVLLGVPGLLVGGQRARILALYALSGIMCFFFFERYARYVLPFLIPMMVVAGIAACRLGRLRRVVAAVLAASFVFGLVLQAAAVHFKAPVVLGRETRQAYLTARVERYPAFEWVNRHIPIGDTILTFNRRSYFFDGRTYQNDAPLRALFGQPVEAQAAWLAAQGIKWIFIPATYIAQAPGYKDGYRDMIAGWRSEKRFFRSAQVIEMPNPRTGKLETVEVYYVNYANPTTGN
ncbi:MAG TPA: glycosyltransferase family 39 protein [Candidatus Hydrogenedentes bacterium]|nr:glycosyltransferase family 39 protein [Candidatus Hydrogenedentota bacterium]